MYSPESLLEQGRDTTSFNTVYLHVLHYQSYLVELLR